MNPKKPNYKKAEDIPAWLEWTLFHTGVAGEDDVPLIAVGFDDAFLGIDESGTEPPVIAYDRNKCIDIIVARDGMTREDAEEVFEYNVIGYFVGRNQPHFITLFRPDIPKPLNPDDGDNRDWADMQRRA